LPPLRFSVAARNTTSFLFSPMPRRQDIDHILRNWSYEPGVVSARLIRAGDGREVLQVRIEMGVLQLETSKRPDGLRPGGCDTYLDHRIQEAIDKGEGLELTEDQCAEVDREFVQFYQRRVCWLALGQFRRAVRDADHTLSLMDFVARHSPSEEWTASHEQYRPFVLLHRTQAAALATLEKSGPEPAIEEINRGLRRMKTVFEAADAEDEFDDDEMVRRLIEMREALREQYEVGPTLRERLAEAVAAENYELAAELRDEIARRGPRRA